ncbi:hypothetical protein J6590_002716 [Homalodisca vitripennis]|nr:hypothetical protein J6590_002716 [Homalodisca vitripennis]
MLGEFRPRVVCECWKGFLATLRRKWFLLLGMNSICCNSIHSTHLTEGDVSDISIMKLTIDQSACNLNETNTTRGEAYFYLVIVNGLANSCVCTVTIAPSPPPLAEVGCRPVVLTRDLSFSLQGVLAGERSLIETIASVSSDNRFLRDFKLPFGKLDRFSATAMEGCDLPRRVGVGELWPRRGGVKLRADYAVDV